MGCIASQDKVQPVEKEEEGRLEMATEDEFEGPTKSRSCTDVIWIFIWIAYTISLFALLFYCIKYGDVNRLINGYDNCGNVCGRITLRRPEPEFACMGANMTSYKYLLIRGLESSVVIPNNVHKECVRSCDIYPEYRTFLNRCIPKKGQNVVNSVFSNTGLNDFFHEVSEDLNLCWKQILYLCLFALLLSFVVLVLLRFLAKFVVWVVLLMTVIVCLATTIYLWLMWKSKKNDRQDRSDVGYRVMDTYFVLAIVATVITVIILLIIIAMRKRIALVVQLFEEASTAVSAMPLLLPLPFMTYISLAAIMTLWIYFSMWIESSGHLKQSNPGFYYQKDTTIKVTRWYNLLGMFWVTQFCLGCQHMIIAGAVASWFFTRNKDKLRSPILASVWNLLRFHFGSVIFGSLIIAMVQLLRALLSYIQKSVQNPQNDCTKCLFKACQCCLYCFEKFVSYISRNAYIEIAIYGHTFCKGGQQAFKLLTSNALRVAAINSVGDFVLFLGKALVVVATVFLGSYLLGSEEGVQHMWVPLVITGIFAYFISHCFMTLYEMVIDTIFLCFCEDCEINDGISKPYFMNRGLMEFVQNSKKVLAVGE